MRDDNVDGHVHGAKVVRLGCSINQEGVVLRRLSCLVCFVVSLTMGVGTSHAAGSSIKEEDALFITLLPLITIAEIGLTIYYHSVWLSTGTTSSSSGLGGESGPQDAFVMQCHHDLSGSLVVDTSGVLHDAAKVYGVPDEAFTRFTREVRRRRHALRPLLTASAIKPHLPQIRHIFLTASAVARGVHVRVP